MTARIASLLRTAREVSRRIWASLPLGFRILALFDNLAADSTDVFGRMIYAEFLRRGVKGMPPIRGKSPEEYIALIGERGLNDKNLSSKLPPGYGKEFAVKARNILRKKYPEHIIDEAMSNFMFRFHNKGSEHLTQGASLTMAEGYVLMGLKNEAINARKREKNLGDESLSGDEERDEKPIDIRDTHFLQKIEDQYPIHEILRAPDLRRDLLSIARWAPQYIELALEGYSDDEIFGFSANQAFSGSTPSVLADQIGEPFVPRPGSTDPLNRGTWSMGLKAKIYKALIDFARD